MSNIQTLPFFVLILTLLISPNITTSYSLDNGNEGMIDIPIRWCAVEGTPAVEDPYFPNPYGEIDTTTEDILDTRLKMINDNIFNPIGISFYSLHHNLSKPDNLIPVIQDPNVTTGEPGNRSHYMEAGMMINSCNSEWEEKLQSQDLPGITAINVRLFLYPNGTLTDIFGSAFGSPFLYLFTSDNKFTSSLMDGGLGWNIDELDRSLGHEVGHTLGLNYHTNNPDELMFGNLKKPDGTSSGIELSQREISKMRNNSLLIPGANG